MLKSTKVGWYIARELTGINAERRKKRWNERHKKLLKLREESDMMIRIYGKLRYYLSIWFGQWVLFAWNRRKMPNG